MDLAMRPNMIVLLLVFAIPTKVDAARSRKTRTQRQSISFARIERVVVRAEPDHDLAILESSVPVTSWRHEELSDPKRFVLWLPRTTYTRQVLPTSYEGSALRDIAITKSDHGSALTFYLDPERKVSTSVSRKGEFLHVRFELVAETPLPSEPTGTPRLASDQLYGSLWQFIPGFVEHAMAGRRIPGRTDAVAWSMAESRIGFDLSRDDDYASLRCRYDFVVNGADRATTSISIRDLHVAISNDWLDFKIGRFVSTWGVGELVFLNDLFRTDWESFFLGRDDDYLKAPANTIRLTLYTPLLTLDAVVMPTFEPDIYIASPSFTFWNPMLGELTTFDDAPVEEYPVAGVSKNGEVAARAFGTLLGWEWAVYGFHGRYHQPVGFRPDDPANPAAGGTASFPRLRALGASLRGMLFGIVLSAEVVAYRSVEDPDGTDPFLPNSEDRWVVGASFEPLPYSTLGTQVYQERLRDMDEATKRYRPDADRTWLTLLWSTRLPAGLNAMVFAYYSPNEKDYYLRSALGWRFTDELTATMGANLWGGDSKSTFYGQFEQNSNVYARMRYSF